MVDSSDVEPEEIGNKKLYKDQRKKINEGLQASDIRFDEGCFLNMDR